VGKPQEKKKSLPEFIRRKRSTGPKVAKGETAGSSGKKGRGIDEGGKKQLGENLTETYETPHGGPEKKKQKT